MDTEGGLLRRSAARGQRAATPAGQRGSSAERYPNLTALLHRARACQVEFDGVARSLVAWDRVADGKPCGWVLEPPGPVGSPCPEHGLLLEHFFGTTIRFGEVDSWLANTHGSLLAEDTFRDAGFVAHANAWETHGVEPPIDLAAFYPISWENGRTTIANRETSEVLLFAQDHSFTHIDVLEGCPRNTLYRIRGAGDFVAWVEAIAGQWLRAVCE